MYPISPVASTAVTKKDILLAKLKEFIAEEGLWWTGFKSWSLWVEGKGKEQFQLLFDFLLSHRSSLGKTLKEILSVEDSEWIFANGAAFDFVPFIRFVESVYDRAELDELILPPPQGRQSGDNRNLVRAWTTVTAVCGAEVVGNAWDYFKGRLGTRERKREFLLKKDSRNIIALVGASYNYDPQAILCVWGIFLEEFSRDECREILFESWNGVKIFRGVNVGSFLNLVFGLLRSGFIRERDTTRLFLSRNNHGAYYLLIFSPRRPPPPQLIHAFQGLLTSRRFASTDVLDRMKIYYECYARSCLESSSWIGVDLDYDSSVEKEFESIRPSIPFFPWEECSYVSKSSGKRVGDIQFKAFLVLLQRQMALEERLLGRGEMLRRLRDQWTWMLYFFPLLSGGDDGDGSRELLVLLTLAIFVSRSLEKEEVAGVLWEGRDDTAFHDSLEWGDPGAFLALYDVARWTFSEDALWKVYSFDGTLLARLLQAQEEELFKPFRACSLSPTSPQGDQKRTDTTTRH